MPSNTQNPTEAPSELQHLIKLLVSQLGINPDTIPATLTPEEAGKVLARISHKARVLTFRMIKK